MFRGPDQLEAQGKDNSLLCVELWLPACLSTWETQAKDLVELARMSLKLIETEEVLPIC